MINIECQINSKRWINQYIFSDCWLNFCSKVQLDPYLPHYIRILLISFVIYFDGCYEAQKHFNIFKSVTQYLLNLLNNITFSKHASSMEYKFLIQTRVCF